MADFLPLRIAPTDQPEADRPEAGPPTPTPDFSRLVAELQDLEPLVVDAKRLAKLLCAGVRTVRTWDAAGKLPAHIRISGRVFWSVTEIRAWLAAGAPDRATWEVRKAASRK